MFGMSEFSNFSTKVYPKGRVIKMYFNKNVANELVLFWLDIRSPGGREFLLRFNAFPENKKKDFLPSARGQKQNKSIMLYSRKMKF